MIHQCINKSETNCKKLSCLAVVAIAAYMTTISMLRFYPVTFYTSTSLNNKSIDFRDKWFPDIKSLGNELKSIPARIDLSRNPHYAQTIPRRIYQTWINKSFSGINMRTAVHSWIHLNPEYDYVFFDDEECEQWILTHCGQRYLNAYQHINKAYGAARCDYFRYLLMWKWGGIYVDIDSSLRTPFREWISRDDEFITGSGWDVPNQWILIAKKNHTIYRRAALALTEDIEHSKLKTMHITEVTGPLWLRQIYKDVLNERYSNDVEDVIIKKITQRKGSMNVGGNVVFKYNQRAYTEERSKVATHWTKVNATENPFYVNNNNTVV